MKCIQQIQKRTAGGYIASPARFEPCEGHLEASTKIYLDVEAEQDEQGNVVITDLSVSHLNDEINGQPLNVESELRISCSGCGHDYSDAEFSTQFKQMMGLQPIGNAERTLGTRGGLNTDG